MVTISKDECVSEWWNYMQVVWALKIITSGLKNHD